MKIITISKDKELDIYRKSDFRKTFKVGISNVDTIRTSGDYAYIFTVVEKDEEMLLKIVSEIIHNIGKLDTVNQPSLIYAEIRNMLNGVISESRYLNVTVTLVQLTNTVFSSGDNLNSVEYGPLSVDCDILYVLS